MKALRAQKVAVSLHRQKDKTSSGRQGIFDMLEQQDTPEEGRGLERNISNNKECVSAC